jgi:hypothetical protein
VANSSEIFDTLNGGCKTHQLVKLYELDKALWKKVLKKRSFSSCSKLNQLEPFFLNHQN